MERAEKRSRPAQVQYQDDTAADGAPGRGSVPWRADGPAGDRAGTAQSRIDAAWEIAPVRSCLVTKTCDMSNKITVRWQDWSSTGLEHLVLREDPDGITAEAVILA